MSAERTTQGIDAMPWFLGLCRAVPAVVLALLITFSTDHSARLGLGAFGAYAVVSGLGILVIALTRLSPGTVRLVVLCQGAAALATGGSALAVLGGGYGFFVLVLSAYAAVSGFLDLYLGARAWRRSPRNSSVGRDWVFVGALSVVLALTALLLPSNYSQPYSVEGVQGVVTASVALVGVFGAYLAIIGIYLAIAAFSIKWSVAPSLPRSSRVDA